MKALYYILTLIFLSSCSSAQNHRLVKASHMVSLGGVKGARAEKFEIVVQENPQLAVKYLLVGSVKIDLIKERRDGILHLKGTYFPEVAETVDMNGNPESPPKMVFDLENVSLVSENIVSKKAGYPENYIPGPTRDRRLAPLGRRS